MPAYDLELDRVVEHIKRQDAKLVCIQLPEGLKPDAQRIQDRVEHDTGANVVIWMGSCYGACDVPLEIERLGVDLLVQWGHSEWS
ncbi:diphthamide synthesis protein [Candidatus Woesearchaeota archaeon]|nr:diphthamide synthesis protein [Candidatus Woesearchaeota archaeon]